MGLFVCTLILGVASFATAGVPDLGYSEATMPNYGGTDAVSLFNLPNGGGSAFAAAQLADGTEVDATIQVTVRDGNQAVIPGFPGEDIWLASADGGMVACTGGTSADADTDADGVTQWVTPLAAGGSSMAVCHILISGDALTSPGSDMALHFNSADINGDRVVDLVDVGLFAGPYFGAYDYAVDFYHDGVIDLVDLGRFAVGNGAACP